MIPTLYIAASYRHLHAVQMLMALIRDVCPGVNIFDWTEQATPPAGLTAAQRRAWMDSPTGEDLGGGRPVFDFCRAASTSADIVIYYGESGQDAGVEIGMAAAAGATVLGLAGPLESPGLMLHGAISQWAASVPDLLILIEALVRCKADLQAPPVCDFCPVTGCTGKWIEEDVR